MREAAEPAVTVRGFGEIEISKSMGEPRFWGDAEMLEIRLADQVRRLAGHFADAEIDARLAEVDRRQLRVCIGHVQHARVAERADIVKLVALGRAADTRNDACHRRSRENLQHVAATHRNNLLSERPGYRVTASGQSFSCSLACAIEPLAKASACCAWATASSNLPASAAFFAAAMAWPVVVHWFLISAACLFAASAFARAALKSSAEAASAEVAKAPTERKTATWIKARARMRIAPFVLFM